MLAAYDVHLKFLRVAGSDDLYMESMFQAFKRLTGDSLESVRARMMLVIQEYLLVRRAELIQVYCDRDFGGVLNAPHHLDTLVNPDREKLLELNGLVGYYKLDRTVIHIYLDAHLRAVVNGYGGDRDALDTLMHDLRFPAH